MVPCVFVWFDGAPLPPFASKVIVYFVEGVEVATSTHWAYNVVNDLEDYLNKNPNITDAMFINNIQSLNSSLYK